ncbi:MAG: hypothetical protein K0S18_935 [Anaerocolumna sp.]|jgi:uncharacterized LabA/DUF88 family protein|nr:hypothetical protein [Anaerocolumna sp.]
MVDEKRFAVLIDADNVSAKYIKYILDEISNYGVATYKRIYGDWTKSTAGSWKDVLLENSVTPVQQYSYTVGKNATDSAMIIDAMDILYSGNVEGFCIVSSDSDFTKLSSRLRESGMLVVGMGEKKTPKPFIAACNQFKYLDVLAETEKKSIEMEDVRKTPLSSGFISKQTEMKESTETTSVENEFKVSNNQDTLEIVKNMTDINVIKSAIIKMMNEIDAEDQSMNMGELGSRLVKRYPDFDVRNYGDTKLSKFLRKFDFLEIKAKGKEGTSMWVSLRQEGEQQNQEKPVINRKKRRNYKRNKK